MSWLIVLVVFMASVISIRADGYKCGVKKKTSDLSASKTVSGTNEWPWIASLHFMPSKEYFCGGTIVSRHHVLTAAHCVDKKGRGSLSPDQILVLLGKHNLSSTEEDFEWFHPQEILVHPDWEDSGRRFDADIAILVSGMPIPLSDTIAPICLWTDLAEDEDYVGTLVGWGMFGTTEKTDVPRQLQVRRVTSARCYEDFHVMAAIASARTFCAGSVEGNVVPCTGFSGGGFFIEENGVWFVQGIVSSAIVSGKTKSCDASKYSLYTKVNEYLSWINDIINLRTLDHRIMFSCEVYFKVDSKQNFEKVCQSFGLSVLQPSARVILIGKESAVVFKVLGVKKQDTVYFPYGFGTLFPYLTTIEIIDSKLRYIDRSSFEDMKNVANLYFRSNPISSVPNDAFFDLKNLQQLKIVDCKLTRLHRNLLSRNSKLTYLDLGKNLLESLPSELLKNNTILEIFIVQNNRIKFIDDKIFASLVKLEKINLSHNFLQNVSANAFSDLGSLNELILEYNRLKSMDVDILSSNLALKTLSIKFNQIAAFENGMFRNNLKMRIIILDQNQVKNVHESLIANLTNLEIINFNALSISNLPVEIFSTLAKAEYILIQNNELKTLNKDLLRKNQKLNSFRADFNKIGDLDPTFFENNTKLTTITLSNNQIKTVAKNLFDNLWILSFVDLSFNYIASISADTFKGLRFLVKLKLNENNINVLSRVSILNNLPRTKVIFSSGTKYSDDKKLLIRNLTSDAKDTDEESLTRIDALKCGRKLEAVGLIVNGTASEANGWPWIASLVRSESKEYFCGGSIISDRHVVTAAHCLHNKHQKQDVLKPQEFLVYLGKHNLSALEEKAEWFYPHEVLVHPEWTTDDVRFDADIAVIVSEAPITFSTTISPVCLWTELEEDGHYFGTVVGWGGSEDTGMVGHTDVPYEVQVQRVPSAKCYEDQYKIAKIGSSRSFCARGVVEYSGPCRGDSGGGFFAEQNGVWYLQGIVSSSMMSRTGTCDVSKNTLYTKINEFLSWINLKNKAYDIRLRGHLDDGVKNKLLTFNSMGLKATQPSGNVVLDWRNSMLNVDALVINQQNVVYLPNGIGRLLPTFINLEIRESNLRFIEKENFYNMQSLISLKIFENPMKNIPANAFDELKNLTNLEISKTRVVLLQRGLFSNNAHLVYLNLSYNQIESLPYDLLRKNIQLRKLDLSYNNLKFVSNEFFLNLHQLEEVYLSNNRIQNVWPETFKDLKSLKVTKLDSNRIKSLHIDTFSENEELLDLYLELNPIEDISPGMLRNNLQLETISLQHNRIKEFSSSMFQNLSSLNAINLDDMHIKELPKEIFSTLTGLTILRLSFNNLEVLHKDLLRNNENLKFFFAKFNRINYLDTSFFRNNSKLRSLVLSNNQLTSIKTGLFQNLMNMNNLELSWNLIETIDVDAFSDLIKLEKLYFSNNNLRILSIDLFSNLTSLNYIDFSSNSIESLPFGLFRNNNKLQSILFNFNRLTKIDLKFDATRTYNHLLFFGNICVDVGALGGILIRNKAEIVRAIVKNCSDLNNNDLDAFKSVTKCLPGPATIFGYSRCRN